MHPKNTCFFTGHRLLSAFESATLTVLLRQQLERCIQDGATRFCAGGALGFDTLAAQAVLSLRAREPRVRLILVLPCRGQVDRWSRQQRAVYASILKAADHVIYTAEQYYPGCMQRRNRALVSLGDLCICYLTKSAGGAKYTVNCAAAQDRRIVNLADFFPNPLDNRLPPY